MLYVYSAIKDDLPMSEGHKKPDAPLWVMTLKLIVLALIFIVFAVLAGLTSNPMFWNWAFVDHTS